MGAIHLARRIIAWPAAARLGVAALVVFVLISNAAFAQSGTRRIFGTVIDDQGKPVPAARLCWHVRMTSDRRNEDVAGTTDSDGKFQLEAPAKLKPERPSWRSDMLWVLADGKSLNVVRATSAAEPQAGEKNPELLIRLDPATDTAFRIFDSDGDPVPGAVVEPWHFLAPHNAYDIIPDRIRKLLSKTTDRSGRVQMPAMPRKGFMTVQVSTESHGVQQIRIDPRESARAERPIALRDTGRIAGSVIADKPEWARGLKFFLTTSAPNPHLDENQTYASEGIASVDTDEDGKFVVPAIATGQLRITTRSAPDAMYLPRLPESGDVLADATSDVEIPMVESVLVRGWISTEDANAPVPGAEIHVYYGAPRQGENVVSDDKGRYELRVLPGAVATQVIAMPEKIGERYVQTGSPWAAKQQVPDDVREFELRPIVLSPVEGLEGTLQDHRGRPLAKMRLNGLHKNRRYGFGKTDEKGRFWIKVPRQITLESFEVWDDDQNHLVPTIEQEQPLVLRVEIPDPPEKSQK